MSDDLSITYDELIKETDLSWGVKVDGGLHYMPKSQCRIYEKSKKIFAPEWLLTQKGLL